MSLRLRLIVVFFLLSVVPVGAVTYFTYANNAQAIRDAAGFEAEVLAGDLSQRMRVVTTQLTQRVESSLMAMQAASQTETTATPAAAPVQPAAEAVSELEQMEAALGNLVGSLNNIEIRGLRGGGRGGRGGGPPGGGRGAGDGGVGDGGRGIPPQGPPPNGQDGALIQGQAPPADSDGPDSQSPQGRRGGGRFGGPNGAPDGRGGGPGRGTPPPADPNRISIDLGQVRREMFDQLVPDQETFDALTPEQRLQILARREAFDAMSPDERSEIFAQINQRMQGVQQGIDVLRKELESRAVAISEIRTQGATDGPAPPTNGATQAPTAAAGPATPPAPPVASPAAPPTAPTPPVPPVLHGSTELSGRRLAVRVERDGEIVGEVDADVDFNVLLATVFETTSRDRGEVPFAVGPDGHLYTPTDDDRRRLSALETAAVRPDTDPGTTILPDWIVATTADPTGSGLKFGVARPVGDALRDLQQTSARNAALGLGFIGLALIAIVPLSGRLTRNLDRLSEGVNRIAQGDYAARVQVRSHDEIGRLARAFNVMAADVEQHQRSAVEQERIRRELELGRQIQHDMLPRTPLRLGLTEVKGVSVPAREVGGDFFNYFQLQDGTIALLVGDVSGKGVGAALLMANIQAALRTRLSLGQDLASLAQELDVDIDRTTPGPVYATLFVGILDPVARHLRCVNAGHNPQYILRAERRLERMESTGRPIGLYSGGGYTEQHFDLAAGDVLFFYTDGCVEAENAAGEMFGTERLEAILSVSAGRGADEVIVAVEADVSRFRAGVELQDDATMMVVKVG